MTSLRRGLAERLRLIVPEALSRSGRCQRHGLEYTNRTGAENLQVLTGDWIEIRALCTNLKSISMDFGHSEY